jgi:hypothetical protein
MFFHHENTDTFIRFGAFLVVFAVLAIAEVFAPRRRLTTSKSRRWFANLSIIALNPLSPFLSFRPILPRTASHPDMHHHHDFLSGGRTNSPRPFYA